jgi:hypothetical protein
MSLTPYNTNIMQALKWQHNNAPNITALIQQKSDWYETFNDLFWTNWEQNVFDLRSATPFGILIWCVILGVPSQLFGLFGNNAGWAYGNLRKNYIYSGGVVPPPAGVNVLGGNFAAGGNTTILNLQEARWALQLRYASLVSNGTLKFVNFMLNLIFNAGQPWNYAAGKYFYVADSTVDATAGDAPITIAPITGAFNIKYVIGHNMGFSAQFVNLLNSPQYGIAPQFAGSKYTVTVD